MEQRDVTQREAEVLVYASGQMRSADFHEWAAAYFADDADAKAQFDEFAEFA